jgi:two-component system cell cycle sensor histidine kinase/response regulator CckA
VVRDRQTLLVEDIETDERTLRPSEPKYGSPSFLSMPIFIREKLVAVINLSRKEGHIFFDPNDEQIAAIMIGEIAFALENIKLHLEIKDHLNNLERRTLELEGANKLLTTEIDNRKQAEVALNEAYEELKQTQAQLVQSAKLSSIGELSAGVAHELNQPLMVIRGHAQMLLRQLTPEMDFYEEMELIEKNTKRLMRIINHLRVFSRQSDTNFMALDVNNVIENAFLMIAEQLRLKEIGIDQKLNPALPEVRGDENQLEQVLLNLITNARDAIEQRNESDGDTSTASKKLAVETRYAESNGEYVEILVSDTGCGIPKEDAHKIFDPFFTSKAVGSGTGLGLSISYGIIQDHKGNIEVSETGPEGTTICVKLPVLSSVAI